MKVFRQKSSGELLQAVKQLGVLSLSRQDFVFLVSEVEQKLLEDLSLPLTSQKERI